MDQWIFYLTTQENQLKRHIVTKKRCTSPDKTSEWRSLCSAQERDKEVLTEDGWKIPYEIGYQKASEYKLATTVAYPGR